MDDKVDLLQIKIEKAKAALPVETQNAIALVDWRATILQLREKRGYTFEQLGDLELETELLLCGLLNPRDYPKELESRMHISKAAANELANEMNDLVFKKIREELVRNTERKKIFAKKNTESAPSALGTADAGGEKKDAEVLSSHGIEIVGEKEILPVPEKLELAGETHPILAQKISGSFQVPVVNTEHTLENITKTASDGVIKPKIPNVDPYREIPE